ncbi:MAG: hypothetical protein A2147_00255 [Chloroflexi bacterium RBG_16_57_8]|nr:MAG: hypothetical protein A2147_00255 [Chloroflexi bacterium RBG_16_57_8]
MSAGNGTKPRILVVDDEPRILRFVRLSLHALGFEVLMASGGEEALKLAEAENPDVMILDVFMPGMDGFEVLQRRRAFEDLKACPRMPVIIFSARSSIADQAFKLGANDFISKPFLPEELAEKIRSVAVGGK